MTFNEIVALIKTTVINALFSSVTSSKLVRINSSGVMVADYDIIDAPISSTAVAAADWATAESNGTYQVTVTGLEGQRAYDSNYKYECVGTNTWRRQLTSYGVKDFYAGTINDSTGVRTAGQLDTAFPSAVAVQRVYGLQGYYEKKGTGWQYYPMYLASGTITASGTGSATAFTVSFASTLGFTPSNIQFTPTSAVGANPFFITAITTTGFTLNFVTAPASGTNNIVGNYTINQ